MVSGLTGYKKQVRATIGDAAGPFFFFLYVLEKLKQVLFFFSFFNLIWGKGGGEDDSK